MPNDYYSSLKVHGYDTHPSDHVHHPSHYQIGGIETIKLLKSVLPKQEYIGFLKETSLSTVNVHRSKGMKNRIMLKPEPT